MDGLCNDVLQVDALHVDAVVHVHDVIVWGQHSQLSFPFVPGTGHTGVMATLRCHLHLRGEGAMLSWKR